MTALVDTTFLVALFNPDDGHHDEAKSLYEDHGAAIVNQPVLTEFLGIVHYRFRTHRGDQAAHRETRERLRRLTEVLRFHVQPLQRQRQALKIFRTHPGLSFVDAAAVADAPPGALGLWTFDRRQARVHRSERG